MLGSIRFSTGIILSTFHTLALGYFAHEPMPAMYNPNGLLSQKLCHNLYQGRIVNDILMRARTLNGLLWS